MAEYESRSPTSVRAADVTRVGSVASYVEPARPPPTPAELARDAVVALDRETAALRDTVDQVRSAHAANNMERWTEARTRLDVALRDVDRSRERARARAGDAAPEMAARLATAEGSADELAATARALTEPPCGFAEVAREAEIEAVLAAPIVGSAAAGYQKKEAELRAELDRLSAADSRVLAERLRRARPNDPLASLFSRMTAERRGRLLAHLDGARRREAIHAARSPHAPAPQERQLTDDTCDEPAPAAADPSPAPHDARAEQLQHQAAPIARALGLGVPRLQLGAGAAAIARANRARGVALGDTTYLDAAQLDAGSSASRDVLAHELVHHAQAKLPPSADQGRDAAEAEAHQIAAHYAATGELAQPKLAIDLSRPAADSDARMPGVTAAVYLHMHASRFVRLVREGVTAIEPVLPSGLAWLDYPRFASLFVNALAARVDGFDLAKATALRELVYPESVYAAIDSGRIMLGFDKDGAAKHPGDLRYGSLGLREWSDGAGRAFVHVIESSLRQSVTRMAARYLTAAQRKGQNGGSADGTWSPVAAGELVMSHPMDSLVTPALPAHGVIEIGTMPWKGAAPRTLAEAEQRKRQEAAARDRADAADATTPRTKNRLRALDVAKLEWQGAKDPKLWNWVKVAEPDATAEEVAEAIWGSGAGDKSIYAYGITAMAPYFGLPKSWARKLAGAGERAPTQEQDESPHDNAIALANSSLAEEVALLQSGGGDKPDKQLTASELGELLQQMTTQLAHIEPIVTAWGEGGQLAGVREFVVGKTKLLAVEPAKAGLWSNALRGQQAVLYDVATQLDQLHGQLGSTGKIDPADPQAAPYRDLVAVYARVAATSHLATTSRSLLATAKEQQRMLIARVVANAARNAEANVQDLRGVTGDTDTDRREMTAQTGALTADAAKLQSDLLAGKTPDADQIDELLVTAEEVALKARMRALGSRLATVEKLADQVNDSWLENAANIFDGDIWSLSGGAGALKAKLETIRSHFDESIANTRIIALGEPNRVKMLREGRRIAAAHARKELDDLQKDTNIEKFLKKAYSEIQDAQLRSLVLQIGILIGLSIATAGIGNAVTAGARGFMAARSAQTVAATVGLSRAAMVVTRVGGLAIESALNTAVQVAVLKKPVGSSFLEDFLTNLATSGILHGLRSANEVAGVADDAIRALWKQSAGRIVLDKSIQITGETLVGAATSYVISRALHAGKLEPQTVTGWYLQGAAIAVGRFVGGAASKQLQRLQTLAAVKGWRQGRAMSDEVRALQAAAAQLEANPTHDGALALMRKRGELLAKEHQLLDELAANPVLARQLEGALAKLQQESAASLAEHAGPGALRMLLEGAGLRPTIGDHTWSGTAEEVAKTLVDAQKAGFAARVKATTGEVKTLEIGEAEVRVHVGKPPSQDAAIAHGPKQEGAGPQRQADDPARGSKPKAGDARSEADEQRTREPERAKPRTIQPTEGETDAKGRGLPEFPIAKRDIRVEIVDQDKYFAVLFTGVTASRREVHLGSGSLGITNGIPDTVPKLGLNAAVRHDGKDYAVKIYDDVRATQGSSIPSPLGTHTPLTAFAIAKFNERYKARFGDEPSALGGILADSNKLNFQREYTRLRDVNISESVAKIEAAKRISFGKHRIDAGYTEFEVTLGRHPERVNLGEGLGTRDVPAPIVIVARKP